MNNIICGDSAEVLKTLEAGSVQTCVTSPPYYGLRDYGVDGQIGLEETPEAYVEKLVAVFREVRRVLADDGTLWLNIGDSYAGSGGDYKEGGLREGQPRYEGKNYRVGGKEVAPSRMRFDNLKAKDLIGIPWMVAFALRADGWYLRSDIIWCLSGGAYVYTKTKKGIGVMMVRDLWRLDPSTVQLWNGEKWTQLLGVSKSPRKGNELEIVLRSGERISCTPTHKFPTERGLLEAQNLAVGDCLIRTNLPDNENPRDCVIDEDAAWFAGLYLAEGSRSDDCIQIAGHAKETERWERVQAIARKYGGSATRTLTDTQMNIRVHGRILIALIEELVTGKTAKDKGFAPPVWKYSNKFIAAMLDGYLSGDGHWDGNRWRLGFTRNYNLERDLRTVCARLGYHLVLNLSTVTYNGKDVPTFRGEIRMKRSGHWNEKKTTEIVKIHNAKCREVYDLGVQDEPHLFALASGILTHNSKPNPMPESVTDRPTKSHEYIFLLSKSAQYYYDAEAIKEPAVEKRRNGVRTHIKFGGNTGEETGNRTYSGNEYVYSGTRNRRDVWTVTTKPYRGAHFATYPPALIEPCILAGSRPGDTVLDPFNGSGTTGAVAIKHHRNYIGIELNPGYVELTRRRFSQVQPVLFGATP